MAGHPTSVVNNSWDVAMNRETIKKLTEMPFAEKKCSLCILSSLCLDLWFQSRNTNSLSVSFQLTDLKEDHEVVFGVTRSGGRASQSAELCGRDWRTEERTD